MRVNNWHKISGLLFIASLALRQAPLSLVAFLLLSIWGVTRLWERYGLARVEYRRRLGQKRVFFGEEVELEVEVTNRKPLPLPWLTVDDGMPLGVGVDRDKRPDTPHATRPVLTDSFSLGWYHRIRRRHRLYCDQRGSFTFGPARIRSGDLFGLSEQAMDVDDLDYLIVYPRILPVDDFAIPSRQPVGDLRTKRDIFEDPVLSLGVREYHYGDSLKRIHWKTSARTGQLQTKVFETTTSIDIGVFLDVRTVAAPMVGTVAQLHELGIIAAASIANQAMDNGYRVGCYVNQTRAHSHDRIRLAPSQQSGQLVRILEALAQIHSSIESAPAARFVTAESRNLPWGSTILMVSAVPSEALLSSLLSIRRAGRRVVLVQVGGEAKAAARSGLVAYRIPDDIDWREIESIRLERLAS